MPLEISLKLQWKTGPDMPFEMSDIQSVQVQGTLYVGGGVADSVHNEYIVMTYDISAGKWATLPPYSTRYFAMTAIGNHLVLVGGKEHDGGRSKMLGVWSENSNRWTHPYPDMTTSRCSCSAVTYEEWLIVVGGNGDGGEDGEPLSSVEIMNTITDQLYTGLSTPIAWEDMKTVIVDDMCYFMGGAIEGYYGNNVSLPALIASQLNSATEIWKQIPQLPVLYATPLSISGSLLAVGGVDKDGKDVNALHLYQPDAGQWVMVANMPTARYACSCILTGDGELLVTGGAAENNNWLKSIDMAEIIDCTF